MTATIIVDSRESRGGIVALLRAQYVETVSRALEVGHYVLAEGVGVERMQTVDFIRSVTDHRLFLQAPRLRQAYARPFLIVEGDLFETDLGIGLAALMDAVSYLALSEGIQVLQTRDAAHSAILMASMARRATEGALGSQGVAEHRSATVLR